MNNPHIRPRREDNRWVLQTFFELEDGSAKQMHWGEAEGFILEGSVPQLEILPSSTMPLYPRNVLDITFMLSLTLPRSAEPDIGVEWLARDRASMLVIMPPEGFIFPAHCEAPALADDDSTTALAAAAADAEAARTALVGRKKGLPPPYECVGTAIGSRSNATLLMLPTDDPHSGMLVQDQLYRVRLVVQNPLYDPSLRQNTWRLLSKWGEKKDSFLTLHDEQVDGFYIRGMQAAVQPASVEPAALDGVKHRSLIN